MTDMESLGKQLLNEGKSRRMKDIAASPEGKKIAAMFEEGQVKKAAESGDTAAMKKMLAQILSTDEGKKLAAQVSDVMKNK